MFPPHARIALATKPVDFRKGPDALSVLVRDALSQPIAFEFNQIALRMATLPVQFRRDVGAS